MASYSRFPTRDRYNQPTSSVILYWLRNQQWLRKTNGSLWCFWIRNYDYQILAFLKIQFSSDAQSCLTLCDPHGLQHARLPCPSPTLGVCSNSCPSSQWCYPTISSSVVPFSSCLQSFPASVSFPMDKFFALDGQSTGASVSRLVSQKKTDWRKEDQLGEPCTRVGTSQQWQG